MSRASHKKPGLSRKGKLLYVLFLLLIVGFGLELSMRLLGYSPWKPLIRKTEIEPGGNFFQLDERLGYRPVAGELEVRLQDELVFKAHNDEEGYRRSGLPDTSKGKDEVWIFGGSFAYGWGINDHETFPWLLQKEYSGTKIRNFSVPGFGTVQSLYQLKDQIARGDTPVTAILSYASFHDQRNVCSNFWMKAIATQEVMEGLEYPWVRPGDTSEFVFGKSPVSYDPFPGMKASALLNFLEIQGNHLQEKSLQRREVTKFLIAEMISECASAGVYFILAGIEPDEETTSMLQYFASQGVPTCMMGVERTMEYSLLPVDPHPNARAHEYYFLRLKSCLEKSSPVHQKVWTRIRFRNNSFPKSSERNCSRYSPFSGRMRDSVNSTS